MVQVQQRQTTLFVLLACIGFDSGDAVSDLYKPPGTFKGGTIQFVGVTVEKTQYQNLESKAKRAMMAD